MTEARREWLDRDYYKDLGLTQAASDEEISAAYKKLVRTLHPDRNPGNKRAEERFKEVSNAHNVIGNPETRRQYDQVRQAGIFGAGPSGGGRYQNVSFDAEDLLSNIFGRGGGDFFQQTGARLRGNDVETEIHLSFDEAMKGTVKSIKGYGNKSVKVRIPAGVDNGERIRVAGKGTAGVGGGPNGDLYVRASVASHNLYERQGKNLVLEVPLSFEEAVLGTTLKVPTYDGEKVEMRIPAGTSSGTKFRIKGKGMPYSRPKNNSTDTKKGDLLIRVEIDVPKKLNSSQKKAVQDMGKLLKPAPREHLNGG